MRRNKGITLITLVVTIIVLIILAAVSITALLGENGLIQKAIYAKEQQEISKYKERMYMAIQEKELEKLSTVKGFVTIEEGIEKIVEKGIVPEGNTNIAENGQEANITTKEEYLFKVTYEENNKIKIEYMGNSDNVTPTLEITKSTDTLTSKVTITVIATDTINGIASIEQVGGEKKTYSEKITEKTETFEITTNGKYTFKVTSKSGTSIEKEIEINNIDEEKPTATYTLNPDADSYGQTVDINIVAEDNNGIKSITDPDGNKQNAGSLTYTATENGEYKFIIEDTVGNVTEYTVNITNVDNTPPRSFWISVDNITIEGFTITGATTTDTESGIAKYEYFVDGVDYGSAIITGLELGKTYNVYVRVTDNAGNTRDSNTIKAGPEITWSQEGVTVTGNDGTVLKVGDYVNYDHMTSKTKSVEVSYYEDFTRYQVLNLSDYTSGWIVWGASEQGELLLISEKSVSNEWRIANFNFDGFSGSYDDTCFNLNNLYVRFWSKKM